MIRKLKSSLTVKIFLLTALLLTACCIATYTFIAWLIPKTYPNQIDMDRIEAFADKVAEELQNTDYTDFEEIITELEETAQSQYGNDLSLHLFDSSGMEIFGSGTSQNNIGTYSTTAHTSTYTIRFVGSDEEYRFFFVDGSQAVNQALEAINKAFPYLIATVIVISLLAASIYSKYITFPIIKISQASHKMIDLDFSVQENVNRTDELGIVYNNLSKLAKKLSLTLNELESANSQLMDDMDKERQLERQRTEFFAAVSHELKTPITIAKGQLQGMICEVGRYKDRETYLVKSLKVINSLEAMVQELLTISRMNTPGYSCRREPFDLILLIRQCLTAQEDFFIQKNMDLMCDFPESAPYHGDQKLLKRVFDNLIANALNYSPDGSRVLVSVRTGKETIEMSIENTHVHIGQEEFPKLFEPFYRSDRSRNRQTGGSGLGLYIVKRILDLHQALYSIENSQDGVIFNIQL